MIHTLRTYCTLCECRSHAQCALPEYYNDGICDDENNNEFCNDGGDCCLENAILDYCKVCECYDKVSILRDTVFSTKTYYFHYDITNHEKGKWSEGPKMKYKRMKHAVGIVTDRMTLKKLVVVTGGVNDEGGLKSTEILLEDSWLEGEITYHKVLE